MDINLSLIKGIHPGLILERELKKRKLAKGKFALCSLQDNIKEIFEISGFTNIFDIYTDEASAMRTF